MKINSMIKCPYCGAEYLSEEIFIGDEFLSKRTCVKDIEGKIKSVEEEEPELTATYICDFCDKKFITTVEITYTSTEDDWDEEYTIKVQ